jgi:hypothetical protein
MLLRKMRMAKTSEVPPEPVSPEPRLLKSPNALPPVPAGDPEMGMNRIVAYAETPTLATKRFAMELLQRCGPLVHNGVQYRIRGEDIAAIPTEFLGLERQAIETGYDKLEIMSSFARPGG